MTNLFSRWMIFLAIAFGVALWVYAMIKTAGVVV